MMEAGRPAGDSGRPAGGNKSDHSKGDQMPGYELKQLPELFSPVVETTEDRDALRDLRLAAARVAAEILKSTPGSPAQTTAINKLIESVQWAERARLRRPDQASRRVAERNELFETVRKLGASNGDLRSLANLLAIDVEVIEDDPPAEGSDEK